MRTAIGFSIVFAVLVPVSLAQAEPADGSLQVHAVTILQQGARSSTGYGVYLGNGLIITAAQAAGHVSQTKPSVRVASVELPANAIKEGWFRQVDLTLLSIDDQKLPVSLRMRRMQLCDNPPWVGESVIVAVPEGTVRSDVMSPYLVSPSLRKRFSTLIRPVGNRGYPGSGVFDATRKCLLGIMSEKIQARSPGAGKKSTIRNIADYFVPASTIRDFIPSEYRL